MIIRRVVYRVAVPVLFALVPWTPAACAQAAPRTVARVSVPFSFQYAGEELPAGTYDIRSFQSNFMAISGTTVTAVGLVRREDPLHAAEPAKLVFQTDGATTTLRDLWIPSMNMHLVCPPPRRRVQQKLAQAGSKTSTVTVALLESPR